MTKEEKLNILCENLSVLGSRSGIAEEERRLTLCHMVSEICSDSHASIEECTRLYKSLAPDVNGDEEIILYEHMLAVGKRYSEMKAEFSIGSLEGCPAGSHGKIACVKNNYNNLALEYFSQKINSSRPVFLQSFTAVCENVSLGESEFCILPIENMTEGKMPGFYSLIDRYELKICNACDIDDEHGNTVRYALLSKGCPEPPEKARNTPFLFEFSILAENGSFIGRLLSAADACGGILLNFDCSPVQYDSGLRRYLFGFVISGRDTLLLRCFLAQNYDYYTPIGFYPHKN